MFHRINFATIFGVVCPVDIFRSSVNIYNSIWYPVAEECKQTYFSNPISLEKFSVFSLKYGVLLG